MGKKGGYSSFAASKSSSGSSVKESRIDPDDGQRLTFDELKQKYATAYSKSEIKSYWNNQCRSVAVVADAQDAQKDEVKPKQAESRAVALDGTEVASKDEVNQAESRAVAFEDAEVAPRKEVKQAESRAVALEATEVASKDEVKQSLEEDLVKQALEEEPRAAALDATELAPTTEEVVRTRSLSPLAFVQALEEQPQAAALEATELAPNDAANSEQLQGDSAKEIPNEVSKEDPKEDPKEDAKPQVPESEGEKCDILDEKQSEVKQLETPMEKSDVEAADIEPQMEKLSEQIQKSAEPAEPPQTPPLSDKTASPLSEATTPPSPKTLLARREEGSPAPALKEEVKAVGLKDVPSPNRQKSSTVTVTFSIPYHTMFGDELRVVGSAASLGDWDPSRAAAMEWTDGHVWVTTVDLELFQETSGKPVEYKYVLMSNGHVKEWEPSGNHSAFQPTSGSSLVCHNVWGQL